MEILESGHFTEKESQTIHVGHLIRVKQDTTIPCDAVVLKTSDPLNQCFVETRSLDGETNLKVKKGPASKKDFRKMTNKELSELNYPI